MEYLNKRILEYCEKLTSVKIYKIICVACAIVHFGFVILFRVMKAMVVMNFNIASVLLYLLLFFRCTNENRPVVGTLAYSEIVLHGILATVYVGWEFGFALYLVCVIPLAFYLSYKRFLTPMIICVSTIVLFIVLKYLTGVGIIVPLIESNLSDTVVTIIYIANSIISFMMLVILSLVYNISSNRANVILKEKNHQLVELAYTDSLTKLQNRRSMFMSIKESFKRAAENGEAFTIVLSDIDDFKQVNDTYGHNAGDMVLKKVSQLVRESLPAGGSACRWGGEEILMLLPDCDVEEGAEFADNLRKAVSEMEFDWGDKIIHITMTFGVTENKGQLSVDKMVSNADKNLYSGKRNGKDCVIC